MFRHSEIYAIIREKQVRRENREAEGGGQLESVDPYNVPAMEIIGALAPDEQACSISNYYEGSCSSTFAEQKNLGISDTRKKRKRNHIDSNGSNGRSITSRGVVRELDSAMADDQVLDYGDESSNTELPMPHDPEVIQTVVGQEAHQTPKPITEGKKIWWPVIEPS